MSEQAIQTNIIKWLQGQGYYVVNGNFSRKGIPDLVCCSPEGKFIGIEVKKPEKRTNTTKLQDYNIKLINETNGIAFVACSVDDVKKVLLS